MVSQTVSFLRVTFGTHFASPHACCVSCHFSPIHLNILMLQDEYKPWSSSWPVFSIPLFLPSPCRHNIPLTTSVSQTFNVTNRIICPSGRHEVPTPTAQLTQFSFRVLCFSGTERLRTAPCSKPAFRMCQVRGPVRLRIILPWWGGGRIRGSSRYLHITEEYTYPESRFPFHLTKKLRKLKQRRYIAK
jgi:hypothetical protein